MSRQCTDATTIFVLEVTLFAGFCEAGEHVLTWYVYVVLFLLFGHISTTIGDSSKPSIAEWCVDFIAQLPIRVLNAYPTLQI